MTTPAILSFITTLILIALLVWAIIKRGNKDNKTKIQYDERQNAIRGKGYMLGFYTVLVFQTLLFALENAGIELPFAPFSLGFIGVILGATVMAVYNIWKGAYWGLNNNQKWYAFIYVFFLLFNLIPVIGVWKTEGFQGLIQGTPLVNFGVEIMLVVLGITFALRHMKDKSEEAEG